MTKKELQIQLRQANDLYQISLGTRIDLRFEIADLRKQLAEALADAATWKLLYRAASGRADILSGIEGV